MFCSFHFQPPMASGLQYPHFYWFFLLCSVDSLDLSFYGILPHQGKNQQPPAYHEVVCLLHWGRLLASDVAQSKHVGLTQHASLICLLFWCSPLWHLDT
mmetsp:Transcript_36351/g.74217  ORF Transcript_36351/g.74217 Transcript_36351/m.74217 type:complete len:99 (-) Transcript_36351:219-515(-)